MSYRQAVLWGECTKFRAGYIGLNIGHGGQRGRDYVEIRLEKKTITNCNIQLLCGNKMPTRCNRGFVTDLIPYSTCFGNHYAHHQELKSIIHWLLPVVFHAVSFKLLVWCPVCRMLVQLLVLP